MLELIEVDDTSTVYGDYNVGGVVGIGHGLVLRKVGSSADVECLNPVTSSTRGCGDAAKGQNIGGLVGHMKSIFDLPEGNDDYYNAESISHSYTTEGVNIFGRQNVGGLVGKSSGSIIHSYSGAMVQGNINVGGLVGEQTAGGTLFDQILFWR